MANDPSFATAAAGGRLVSLDVFRGLTIAAMILVNNPGDWGHIYAPLEHAAWHGWTPTDLIFPFFLFIVGVSMVYSFAARAAARQFRRGRLLRHVIRRSAVLFALGIFLNGFPFYHLGTLRYAGVLQRIALCYLLAAGFVLAVARSSDGSVTGGRFQPPRGSIVAAILVLLTGYWALLNFVPVPGYGAGHLDPEGNLAAYVDRWLMAGHLWQPAWDPEGLLSTLPAIATTLLGVLAGLWLRSDRDPGEKLLGLLATGAAGICLGELLHPLFPINKSLWTSSYVVLTGGFAAALLALCYWLCDVRRWRRWAAPILVYGTNAIAVFTLSSLLARASVVFTFTDADGAVVTWHGYVYDRVFLPLASPVNASLLFAVFFVLLWFAVMWPLYRRRIFIRI